jgi:hypothetical protein
VLKTAGLAVALALVLTGSARAATPVPFTITDTIDFNTEARYFSATGPLCPSGSYTDDVSERFPHSDNSHSAGGIILIRSVLTCDDGSGTFNAVKHLTLRFTPTGFTTIGPFEIHGGTGAYVGISGHGVLDGASYDSTHTGGSLTTGLVQLHE